MGIWILPWKDTKIAKQFKEKMSKPWMAEVYYEKDEHDPESGMYRWRADKLNFMGGIYGADDLWDYLTEVSEKKKKDFDIRKCVIECLNYQIKYFLENPDLIQDTKAFNIVLESCGKKPFKNEDLIEKVSKAKIKKEKLEIKDRESKKSTDLKIKKIAKKTINIPSAISLLKKKKSKNEIWDGRVAGTILFTTFGTMDEKPKRKSFVCPNRTKALFTFGKEINKRLKEKYILSPEAISKISSISLIMTDKKSNKFWRAQITKTSLEIKFGRLGTEPRTLIKDYKVREKAHLELYKLVSEKTRKGYLLNLE